MSVARWIPEEVKRPLREHPLIGRPYMALARRIVSAEIRWHEWTGGRYYRAELFDRIFSDQPDPWGYVGDPTSEERRERILDLLPRERYRWLLEIGSAEGWMTDWLAQRAETLVSVDLSGVALRRARRRCAGMGNTRFLQMDVLHDCVAGPFDGIVCGGVLVFLPRPGQVSVRDRVVGALAPGGDLLLEHTRAASPGEVAGSEIHALYRRHPALSVLAHEERDVYAITVFRKSHP